MTVNVVELMRLLTKVNVVGDSGRDQSDEQHTVLFSVNCSILSRSMTNEPAISPPVHRVR
jgi:hypothetical protein